LKTKEFSESKELVGILPSSEPEGIDAKRRAGGSAVPGERRTGYNEGKILVTASFGRFQDSQRTPAKLTYPLTPIRFPLFLGITSSKHKSFALHPGGLRYDTAITTVNASRFRILALFCHLL
jgi:hypothetical protein